MALSHMDCASRGNLYDNVVTRLCAPADAKLQGNRVLQRLVYLQRQAYRQITALQ